MRAFNYTFRQVQALSSKLFPMWEQIYVLNIWDDVLELKDNSLIESRSFRWPGTVPKNTKYS